MDGIGESALLVVDVQQGFDDADYWGRRNNPSCESNIGRLIDGFRAAGQPIVFVRHDSIRSGAPLHPDSDGNAFKDVVTGDPDLLVSKRTNSAFYGAPDLHAWLTEHGVHAVTICGITTNHCCETTARMAGNLGYATFFVLDATHTFEREGPDGTLWDADDLARVTAANLHGEFATVVSTKTVVSALGR